MYATLTSRFSYCINFDLLKENEINIQYTSHNTVCILLCMEHDTVIDVNCGIKKRNGCIFSLIWKNIKSQIMREYLTTHCMKTCRLTVVCLQEVQIHNDDDRMVTIHVAYANKNFHFLFYPFQFIRYLFNFHKNHKDFHTILIKSSTNIHLSYKKLFIYLKL